MIIHLELRNEPSFSITSPSDFFISILAPSDFFFCFLAKIHSQYDDDKSPGMSSSYFRVSSALSAIFFVKMRHFSEISKIKKKHFQKMLR